MILHPNVENVTLYQAGRCVVQIALFSKNATLCSLAKLFALGGRSKLSKYTGLEVVTHGDAVLVAL
jgi:hypothetical protein